MICEPCSRGCSTGTCRNRRCDCPECGGYDPQWLEGYLHGLRTGESVARNRQADAVVERLRDLIRSAEQ